MPRWRAQVFSFLVRAVKAGQLCLPKLANVVLYLDLYFGSEGEPGSTYGFGPEPEEHACYALGELVEAGVLPTLRQAKTFHFDMHTPRSSHADAQVQPAHLFCGAADS
jgi:hypothetical protein